MQPPPETDPDAPPAQAPLPRIPLYRSIRGKLTALVALLIALTTAALTVTDYAYVRSMLNDSLHEQLKLHGEGLREVLLAYIGQQHERVALVASRTRLRQLLGLYLNDEIDSGQLQAGAQRILLDAQQSTRGFIAISIAGPDGRVITATEEDLLGSDVAALPAFIEGQSKPFLGLPQALNGAYRAILSAPARTNDGVELGVVMVELNVAPMLDILNAIRSGHESTRVRLGASSGDRIRYLFPVADAPSLLDADAETDAAMRTALQGGTGFAEFTDYRAVQVLADYRPVGYRDWALVTQVDADEAYAPVGQLRAVLLLVGVVFFSLAALGALRIARRFSQPILELADVASAIRGGDLNARARVSSSDEVGLLGHAFNSMAESLERHRNHLQDLVRERTAALEERSAQLQKSRDQLADLCRVLESQADVIERDLHRAEVIQRSLLPHEPPRVPDFCVQSLYRPGRNVGGDLYDVVGIGERYIALVIADAAGHGVSAAMLSVLFKHRLRLIDETSGNPYQPGEALARINGLLLKDVSAPGVFVTAAFCLLDIQERELTVASAGHPPLILFRAGGATEHIEHTGPALGLYADAVFEQRRLKLEQGDRMLLYTDGLFDVCGQGAPGIDTIAQTLRALSKDRQVLEKVLVAVSRGQERADRDDVTMLLLDASPGDSHFYQPTAALQLAPAAETELPMITYAEGTEATFICLQGRVTWTYGQALLEAAGAVIDAGRALVIDLAHCEYLDSTLLGTLHEVVERADAAGTAVRLQRAGPELVKAFEELSMRVVIDHISEKTLAIPAKQTPLEPPQSDMQRKHLRLLKAHEILADLSEKNREQFAPVVDSLRSDFRKS